VVNAVNQFILELKLLFVFIYYLSRPSHVVEKRELKKGKCHSLANENIYHGFISLYSLLLNIEI
jgi:hypothetical protein